MSGGEANDGESGPKQARPIDPAGPQPLEPRTDRLRIEASGGPAADQPPDDDPTLVARLAYGLSLPERTARGVSAVLGGLVHETAARLIPAAFRSSRSYSVFVQQALDMMVHDFGGVSPANPEAAATDEAKLAQKAVGGLLDIAGVATLHLSPITVLAVFSDLAYGSGHFLTKLSDELKREGIVDARTSIDNVADLVAALQATSSRAAESVDTPPINVGGLKDTVAQLSAEISRIDAAKLIPRHEVERMWAEMETTAAKANVGLWDVSTTMTMYAMNRVTLTSRGALSTMSVAGNLFEEHWVDHYAEALREIHEQGLYATLATASAPYLEAVWLNFDETRVTWTEDLLSGRLIRRTWTGFRGWWITEH